LAFIGAVINIRGVVQGVGFRYWCLRHAQNLGVNGTVGNRRDGSVQVIVEGERALVEEMIRELKIGPTYAHVTDLDIEWYEQPRAFKYFNVVLLDKND